jgi:cytochrome c oxidase subunit 1
MATLASALARPTAYGGLWGWLTTVDHKRIGILYGITALAFFVIGGVEALLLRLQLAQPEQALIEPALYNQLFTMHALTMIFLGVMPLGAAFFNFMIPLMIGARDVAFPRLNAFSYWTFLGGGLLLNWGWLAGSSPAAGWFAYANLTSTTFSPDRGMDFYVLGLAVLGVSSTAAALNFLVTIINMRAPGMTLMRMPVFIWMSLITMFLIITAFPVITVGLIELGMDRFFGTNFFNPEAGGSPVLWQHLFWVFGHPEVYILILPAMGIISEVLPTFSRKPLFGYPVVVFSGLVIGFMGWMVWSHHMFTVGLGTVANTIFTLTTMSIAIPTGVKIFNWMATLWGGSIKLNTPMLFALGFISMFIIGGLSGVMHSIAPSDAQQQDTYFVVAHIHYVLFGGSIFALFTGIYYWFPKFTGRLMHEGLGKLHFWSTIIAFNITFFPMHILGLDGMPRRVYTYQAGMGWELGNLLATVGAFLIAISMLVFLHNMFRSVRKGELAGNDPWDARTLEWSIPSPPPIYNFIEIPQVHSRDAFWEQKYPDGVKSIQGTAVSGQGGDAMDESYGPEGAQKRGIHLPGPSYYPLVASIGLFIGAFGFTYDFGFWHVPILSVLGLIVTLIGVYGWALEPVADESHG